MRGAAPVLALVALGLTGCGGPGGRYGGESASDTTLHTVVSDLGTIVVDARGRSVYVFDDDTPGSGESACSGRCLAQWPPVEAGHGKPTADGVDATLGTLERDDGTLQVLLNGSPLYLFAGDGEPGDVTGQAVEDVWWVVGPDGKKITEAPDTGMGFSY